MRDKLSSTFLSALGVVTFLPCAGNIGTARAAENPRFEVSFPATASERPITGRLLLMISRKSAPEVRLQVGWVNSPPTFGVDVTELRPGHDVVVDKTVGGFPLKSLADLPAGDYYVQALMNVYTEFHRADGHVVWAHMDQWEGQQFNRSPGNLYSKTQQLHLDARLGYHIKLSLTEIIPPVTVPPDTEFVKHIKIQSQQLSRFWGRPIYIGAVVLLPRGYESHPNVRYPVIYQQGHFSQVPAFGFAPHDNAETEEDRKDRLNLGFETGHEFYQAWAGDQFPRMIAVTFLHPTMFYDDSYAVNSANTGPYGDAIMTELIPYIEEHFRIMREPYARILTGGSTGGWEALALQLFHPDFFGGAWVLYPDPIDFRRYTTVNIYDDDNAFVFPAAHAPEWQQREWTTPLERTYYRLSDGQPFATVRQVSQVEAMLDSRDRSGGQLGIWEAVYGPVGDDGYPKPLWNKSTGVIDHSVAIYMREHGYDLRYFAETNWPRIGPALVGKLHFQCGDMDSYHLNLATYLFEAFLTATKEPYYDGSFEYGRPMKGHGWQAVTNAELVRIMARYVHTHIPQSASSAWENAQ